MCDVKHDHDKDDDNGGKEEDREVMTLPEADEEERSLVPPPPLLYEDVVRGQNMANLLRAPWMPLIPLM